MILIAAALTLAIETTGAPVDWEAYEDRQHQQCHETPQCELSPVVVFGDPTKKTSVLCECLMVCKQGPQDEFRQCHSVDWKGEWLKNG